VPRYVIEYKGGCIELPRGETVVGRGLHCRIRFNDPAVSRRHILLHIGDEGLTGEDLSLTNPSRLNGKPMSRGFYALNHEDVVEVGKTWFRILVVPEVEHSASDDPQTAPGEEEERTSPGLGADEDDFPGSGPSPGGPAPDSPPPNGPAPDNLVGALAAKAESLFPPVVSTLPLPSFELHNCPRCRAKVPVASEQCMDCGYHWPRGRPESPTLRLDARALRAELERRNKSGAERRKHPRVPIDLPAIYDSDSLTFDAVARDISLGGLFLATELLDDVGTECKITVLPDGTAAIPIKGVVCRTVGVERTSTTTAGMGIRFTTLSVPAKIWLASVLMRTKPPASAPIA
jgi:hypothetical protein